MSYDPEADLMSPREEELERLRAALKHARKYGQNERYNEIWDEIQALERLEMQEPDL